MPYKVLVHNGDTWGENLGLAMDKQVKALYGFNSCNQHGRNRDPTSISCPLPSTYVLWHSVCMHTCVLCVCVCVYSVCVHACSCLCVLSHKYT